MKGFAQLLFIILLFINNGCVSQNERNLESNSILWEISRKGIQEKSYLLGTFHSVNYHFFDSIPKYKSIIENVDAIALEHDGAAYAKPKLQAYHEASEKKYPSYALMPDEGKEYRDIFASEEEFHYVDSFINEFKKEQNAPIFNLEEFKPIYTMMVLKSYYLLINMLKRTYDSSLPVNYVQMDKGIADEAFKRRKRLFYLETVEERNDEVEDSLYLDTCNLTRQSHILYVCCKNLARQKKYEQEADTTVQSNKNKAVELYMRGELNTLLEGYEKASKLPPDLSDDYQQKELYNLVSGRNKKWIPVVKSNIQDCPCLIAVGAGHLPGKEGLINLLRNEGYILTPIDVHTR